MNKYTAYVNSDSGHSPADSCGGPDPRRDREITADSPVDAAGKAILQWRKEREFFSCGGDTPDVYVNGVKYVHAAYAMEDDENIYDA